MGLFSFIKEVFTAEDVVSSNEEDYFKIAKNFEEKSQFAEAIREYEKLIATIYVGKEYTKYIHITKKLIELYQKIGNYDKIIELWPKQYQEGEYTPKYKLELALILEKSGKSKEALDVYADEMRLQMPKIEYLMRLRRIDDANAECTRLLLSLRSTDPGITKVWMLKGKILMGIRRWEEAQGYFIKIIERDNSNLDAKKLKAFCTDQLRKY